MKRKFIILTGPPCCGKSTWTSEFIKKHPNTIVVSRDIILMEYASKIDESMTYNEAWNKVSQKNVDKEYKKLLISSGIYGENNIIIDATNMASKRRKGIMSNVSSEFYRECIIFPWDEKEFKKRNIKRLEETGKGISIGIWKNMVSSYQTPSKEEGFDKITFL